ncbi:hypothetical protein EV421DRAFT_1986906 [Armillaria borealis]|uniref:Uncharacterized protein n=1 Tax=Armillaria borealis TaxID=47425 RepID=A0AA39J4B8_9AGAR|nr:hypothetical protein EV421DRAFT_1986906 [Armillaria borealis]
MSREKTISSTSSKRFAKYHVSLGSYWVVIYYELFFCKKLLVSQSHLFSRTIIIVNSRPKIPSGTAKRRKSLIGKKAKKWRGSGCTDRTCAVSPRTTFNECGKKMTKAAAISWNIEPGDKGHYIASHSDNKATKALFCGARIRSQDRLRRYRASCGPWSYTGVRDFETRCQTSTNLLERVNRRKIHASSKTDMLKKIVANEDERGAWKLVREQHAEEIDAWRCS